MRTRQQHALDDKPLRFTRRTTSAPPAPTRATPQLQVLDDVPLQTMPQRCGTRRSSARVPTKSSGGAASVTIHKRLAESPQKSLRAHNADKADLGRPQRLPASGGHHPPPAHPHAGAQPTTRNEAQSSLLCPRLDLRHEGCWTFVVLPSDEVPRDAGYRRELLWKGPLPVRPQTESQLLSSQTT